MLQYVVYIVYVPILETKIGTQNPAGLLDHFGPVQVTAVTRGQYSCRVAPYKRTNREIVHTGAMTDLQSLTNQQCSVYRGLGATF